MRSFLRPIPTAPIFFALSATTLSSPPELNGRRPTHTQRIRTMEYVNPNLETSAAADKDTELVAEDLIEDVSIDGMCGVY